MKNTNVKCGHSQVLALQNLAIFNHTRFSTSHFHLKS
jgi:hypothetical protein